MAVFKDMKQTFLLFLTVTQDIQGITLLHILVEGMGQQIEILMIEWLQRCMEIDDCIGRIEHFLIETHLSERLDRRQKIGWRQEIGLYKCHIFRVDVQLVIMD